MIRPVAIAITAIAIMLFIAWSHQPRLSVTVSAGVEAAAKRLVQENANDR